jgi:alcohol dehydrogenase YqhD (iron-dependent ADH family)
MRDFVFENKTKVYFGKEQLCHLHEEVAHFGKRVLLVYGGGCTASYWYGDLQYLKATH